MMAAGCDRCVSDSLDNLGDMVGHPWLSNWMSPDAKLIHVGKVHTSETENKSSIVDTNYYPRGPTTSRTPCLCSCLLLASHVKRIVMLTIGPMPEHSKLIDSSLIVC